MAARKKATKKVLTPNTVAEKPKVMFPSPPPAEDAPADAFGSSPAFEPFPEPPPEPKVHALCLTTKTRSGAGGAKTDMLFVTSTDSRGKEAVGNVKAIHPGFLGPVAGFVVEPLRGRQYFVPAVGVRKVELADV